METSIYTKEGKQKEKISLPQDVFGLSWNADLVHQVVSSMLTSRRAGTAHTKDRGEVRGGGKKPWKQKGTGRARHGSSRSPIWVGGGVAHGPRNEKNFDRKINKKAKAKALATILSKKFKDGEILFVDSFEFVKPKTKDALTVIQNLSSISGFEKLKTKRTNTLYVATSKKDTTIEKSFSNIGKASVSSVMTMNPVDLLKYKYLVIENPQVSVDLITQRLTK